MSKKLTRGKVTKMIMSLLGEQSDLRLQTSLAQIAADQILRIYGKCKYAEEVRKIREINELMKITSPSVIPIGADYYDMKELAEFAMDMRLAIDLPQREIYDITPLFAYVTADGLSLQTQVNFKAGVIVTGFLLPFEKEAE